MTELDLFKLIIDGSAGVAVLFLAYKIFQLFLKYITKQETTTTSVTEKMLGIMADLVVKVDGSLKALITLVSTSTDVNKEIAATLREFKESVDKRFDTVDHKLDQLERRVKDIEDIIPSLSLIHI